MTSCKRLAAVGGLAAAAWILAMPAGAQGLDLAYASKCEGTTAVFTVTNKGAAWPGEARFRVYERDAAGVAAEPSATLKKGQTHTFKVPAAGKGELGLFVIPNWYGRNFAGYDARTTCK